MPKPSAVDVIQPAIELTKQRLFNPLRYSTWWRIAFLGIFSGEMSNSGGGGGSYNFGIPHHPAASNQFGGSEWGAVLIGVFALVAVALALVLLFMYIASVLRFVLFDAVLTGRHRIREGWHMWRERALPYFRLQILILIAFAFGLAVIVGIPAGIVYANGGFRAPHWSGDTIFTIVVAALFAIAWVIAIATFSVMSKDFVLPMMTLEGVDYDEGWHKLREIAAPQKKDFAIYILMKIVLALAGGFLLAIAFFLTLLVFAIPAAIVCAIGYFVLHLTLATLGGKVLLALLIAATLACTIAVALLMCAPLAVFFPAYSIYFFAPRYQPLAAVLYPPPAPDAPPAPPEPSPAY